MQLTDDQRAKLDDELRACLEAADDGQTIRAIVTLGQSQDSYNAAVAASRLDPRDFPSRTDYRRAMIDSQKSTVESNVGETLKQLRQLDLVLEGGSTTHTVVVVGPAASFAKSLMLSGVRHAELDQEISLAGAGPTI